MDPKMQMNYLDYNRKAWNHLVKSGNKWTQPVSDDVIEAAKAGKWSLVLTPSKSVPASWYAPAGSNVLGLASGGGQQGPVLAAAGYNVTIFDNSPAQLEQDVEVATRHSLKLTTVQGDMADLSVFSDESFDMVFNPCSTAFTPNVRTVYREVARVLKPQGVFMTGFTQPFYYLFDVRLAESGIFTVKYCQPYSDLESLSEEELKYFTDQSEPVVFGHSLEDHFQGQMDGGLYMTAMYEDIWGGENPADKHFPSFVALRSVKK